MTIDRRQRTNLGNPTPSERNKTSLNLKRPEVVGQTPALLDHKEIKETERNLVSGKDKQSKTCGTISQTNEKGSLEQLRESGLPNETSKGKNVVIDRVRAVIIRAPVTIDGIEMNGVVDTGVEITAMNERRFQKIPAGK